MATSAIVPFVIHIFEPFRIQSEPSRRACVRIAPGSEPASGSVSPKQPIASPSCIARQPALLLLLGAPAPDREHRERALNGDEAAHARVARLELHARQPVGDGARTGQAVALEVHPEQAELRKLLRELAGHDPLLEPLADVRKDLLAHELADGVADRPLLVVEKRVDREEVERVERRRLRRGGHAPIVALCLPRRGEMRERESEPGGRVALPEALVVAAGVEAEDVRDPRLRELLVQLLVLGREAPVVRGRRRRR